jgi:hypothetical protein
VDETDLVHQGEKSLERQVADVDNLRHPVRKDQPVEQLHPCLDALEVRRGRQIGQLVGQRDVARAELERRDAAAVHAQEIGDEPGEKGLAGRWPRRRDNEHRSTWPRQRSGGRIGQIVADGRKHGLAMAHGHVTVSMQCRCLQFAPPRAATDASDGDRRWRCGGNPGSVWLYPPLMP